MVVRAVDPAAATLTFFTDARAAKVAALAAAPDVAVIAYDPDARLQLRLRGTATIAVAGAGVEAAWATVPPSARAAYRTAAAPGTPARSAAAAARLGDDDGRGAFAVLTIAVTVVEWLDLATRGHRRAVHRRDGTAWRGEWRVP